ncbi:Conserved hypothetical protein potentially related to ribose or hydroxymethylpyrimidine metabolism [hydrothermal vent metagenome]|uniref:Dihydrodipicolinate synthase family protein n=1 Tax=hydrothermal vent metagenome TaxID=652676 RepID=A0A3B0TP06_9ZZZZ
MLKLPVAPDRVEDCHLTGTPIIAPKKPSFNRIAYAAAHVVADPFGSNAPRDEAAIDWDTTLKFRHHLWAHGFQVAEAMDTSQRGMGLGWDQARELIRRGIAEARTVAGAGLASGAGTDHLPASASQTLEQIVGAYEHQVEFIEDHGGRVIMMASRALAATAKSADDYAHVYGRILSQCAEPVILHWLGDMFDPALGGYWGAEDFETTAATVTRIIEDNRTRVDGIKISLLDEKKEIELRAKLPSGVKMYTGDDFNYPGLIEGDGKRYSDALLGIFDPIAPAASAALTALAQGDTATYHRLLAPTVPLSRKIFEAPTQYYKSGVVFLAWLNGFQPHFTMVGGQQSSRAIGHYADIFRLADKAGLLRDPDLAVHRMKALCTVNGIEQD